MSIVLVKKREYCFGAFGLTLIEVMIVVAMFAAAAAMTAPFLARDIGGSQVTAAAEMVTDALRQAQADAMNGRQPRQFGVHFESSAIVRYSGAVHVESDPDNVRTDFGPGVTVTPDFGGGIDVLFDNHRGLPSVSGTVLVSDGAGQERTVTVWESGAIGR